MKHVWKFKDWRDLQVKDVKHSFLEKAMDAPALGDMSVSDLCCLTTVKDTPVGIYVFSSEGKILYVGKTHGRSLHERMISHIDHREPVIGSPHLAQFVSSLVKRGDSITRDEAVCYILNMQTMWLPVPDLDNDPVIHRKKIAIIERRLLWSECLDPEFNSLRVKKN